jgi:hypothetical protein
MRIGHRERRVDPRSRGHRDAGWITELAGAHPLEAALGAALAGVFLALAVGAVAGPMFAGLGAAVGVVAGACIGNGIGEVIAPRLDAPADVTLANHRGTSAHPAEYDKDDFETYGTDRWPAWYDPVVLIRCEQERGRDGAGRIG